MQSLTERSFDPAEFLAIWLDWRFWLVIFVVVLAADLYRAIVYDKALMRNDSFRQWWQSMQTALIRRFPDDIFQAEVIRRQQMDSAGHGRAGTTDTTNTTNKCRGGDVAGNVSPSQTTVANKVQMEPGGDEAAGRAGDEAGRKSDGATGRRGDETAGRAGDEAGQKSDGATGRRGDEATGLTGQP
jgi:hypothetical protein